MKRTIPTLAALLLTALFSVGTFAQSPDDRADWRSERRSDVQEQVDRFREARDRLSELAEEFNLTDAQRDAIVAIAEAGAAEARQIGSEMLANRDALTAAITGEPVDSAAIETVAAAQAGLVTELVLNRADTLGQIRAVLTVDQLDMITEVRAALQDRFTAFVNQSHPRRDRRLALRALRREAREDLRELAADFGLSPEQRAEVRAILEQAVPETLAGLKDMAANRQDLIAAVAAEPFDAAAVDAIAVEQGALFGEFVLRHADTLIGIREVLSAEQLDFIAELRGLIQERLASIAETIQL